MSSGIVLCVDDDMTVLNAIRTLLTKHLGSLCQIEIAESGDEALEIQKDFQEQGQELSVIISDFIMPGMRGDELLMRIHEVSPNTITIMLTGQSDFEGVKRAINKAKLYRFLEKPFNNADLLLTAKTAYEAYRKERDLTQQNVDLKRINANLMELVDLLKSKLAERQ